MAKETIVIDVPDGMEIDKENSTFECIKFKPIKKELPKTWAEFCETYPVGRDECYINTNSSIIKVGRNGKRTVECDENLFPNKKTAEAFRALMQLVQLRDCYNDGWEPDWRDNYTKHTIYVANGDIICNPTWGTSMILAFKSEELRDQFLKNFRDLIEIAKPLL